MSTRTWTIALLALGVLLLLTAACDPLARPLALTPVPTLAPGSTPALAPSLSQAPPTRAPGAAGTPAGAAGTPAAGAPTPSAAAGQAIFKANCAPCHGDNAEGGVGPALRKNSFITSGDQAVINTISNGRPGTAMPAWLKSNGGSLSLDDIRNVLAYLKTLQ